MSNEYETPCTGLVLTGDVVMLQREVRVLRTLNAVLQRENTTLRALLAASRLPHTEDCLTQYSPAYPCSCAARRHNARIDAALNESPDSASGPQESPGAHADH